MEHAFRDVILQTCTGGNQLTGLTVAFLWSLTSLPILTSDISRVFSTTQLLFNMSFLGGCCSLESLEMVVKIPVDQLQVVKHSDQQLIRRHVQSHPKSLPHSDDHFEVQ